ncbi:hypothetical protein [Pedobacter sp. SYSU D00535]|uniref:hypothetical protein n=1 Tax=Pedobacter sp. SYSU D00535 TaxID=2810308 RepID=UPI001A95F9A7|nr:hypothetical protein [Pedobacter sp. SYSU D00535]
MRKGKSTAQDLALLIMNANNLMDLKKLRDLVRSNSELLESLSGTMRESVESAIVEIDTLEFTLYGTQSLSRRYF